MSSSEKSLTSPLYEAFKNKVKDSGLSMEEAAQEVFGKAYPTVYGYFKIEYKLKTIQIEQLSNFLQVSHSEVISLHNNKKSKRNIYLSFAVLVIFTIFIFFMLYPTKPLVLPIKTSQPKEYISKFSGNGQDINLENTIVFADFHTNLYTYKFKNGSTKITGDNIIILCDVETINNANPKQKYIGRLEASGRYLNGNAAMSYEITVGDGFEKWIGVMMIKMPTIGDYKGYWLTIHTDTDVEGTGIFALGDANLTRTTSTNDILSN